MEVTEGKFDGVVTTDAGFDCQPLIRAERTVAEHGGTAFHGWGNATTESDGRMKPRKELPTRTHFHVLRGKRDERIALSPIRYRNVMLEEFIGCLTLFIPCLVP